MNKNYSLWHKILEDAQWYPSPHNTQPIKVHIIDEKTIDVYYDLEYALPKGDPETRFAWCAVGIFVESVSIAASGLGCETKVRTIEKELKTAQLKGMQKVAQCTIMPSTAKEVNLPVELLRKRKTNRLDYNGKIPADKAVEELSKEAQKYGHKFLFRSDKKSVDWTNELNVRMVFYDLNDKAVRNELAGWSRYTKRQAGTTQDGLSAQCLNVPGLGLRLFMKHYGATKIPGVGQVLKWIYRRNVQNIPSIGWLQGPFFTIHDYVKSGRLLLRIWLIMTKHGIAYQPYGSVITNKRAHQEFCDYFDVDESNQMAWLLMRLGYSDSEPPRSHRRNLEDMIIEEDL